MKIAVCASLAPSWPAGGVQIEMASYVAAFQELGHKSELYIRGDTEPEWPKINKRAGTDIEIRPLSKLEPDEYNVMMSAHTWLPLPNKPVISWWIDAYVMPNSGLGPSRLPCPWEMYDSLVSIWAPTQTMRKALEDAYDIPPIWSIAVIRAPLDLSPFFRAAREERPIDLVFVGREHNLKHPELFVRLVDALGAKAVMALPEWTGSVLPELPDYAILDPSRNELAEILGQAKALVMFSEREISPLVVYEALAAGCRVIAPCTGSIPEQVGPWGYLYLAWDSLDWTAFPAQIERFLGDEPDYLAISDWARRYGREAVLGDLGKHLGEVERCI